jgi:hypothetical protein
VHVKVSPLGHAGQESGEFERTLFRDDESPDGALLA